MCTTYIYLLNIFTIVDSWKCSSDGNLVNILSGEIFSSDNLDCSSDSETEKYCAADVASFHDFDSEELRYINVQIKCQSSDAGTLNRNKTYYDGLQRM